MTCSLRIEARAVRGRVIHASRRACSWSGNPTSFKLSSSSCSCSAVWDSSEPMAGPTGSGSSSGPACPEDLGASLGVCPDDMGASTLSSGPCSSADSRIISAGWTRNAMRSRSSSTMPLRICLHISSGHSAFCALRAPNLLPPMICWWECPPSHMVDRMCFNRSELVPHFVLPRNNSFVSLSHCPSMHWSPMTYANTASATMPSSRPSSSSKKSSFSALDVAGFSINAIRPSRMRSRARRTTQRNIGMCSSRRSSVRSRMCGYLAALNSVKLFQGPHGNGKTMQKGSSSEIR